MIILIIVHPNYSVINADSSVLASLWKIQYFRRSIYKSVEQIGGAFICENSKLFSVFYARLGSEYASSFRRLFKCFTSLKYFTLESLHYKALKICYFFKVLYFFKCIKHAIKIYKVTTIGFEKWSSNSFW